jgi:large subunit ribosomal protein L23
MKSTAKTITLKPRMSEKAYALTMANNVYVFVVPITATKLTVAQAIAAQFDVTVTNVRIVVQKGKAVASRRKRARSAVGHRADMKKAYVTLKDGDHIAIFDAPEETKKDAKADKKADKKSEKSAKKATPKAKESK